MDRDLYVPVRCDEAEAEYSGKWYWEPIIQVNGEVIDRNAVRTRSSFRPGDSVVVKYKSRTFCGVVVDPDQEREETVDPHVHVKKYYKDTVWRLHRSGAWSGPRKGENGRFSRNYQEVWQLHCTGACTSKEKKKSV